jgi:hypothetical protein
LGAATKPKKHILLDGPVGSGKSVAVAMLVQWARARGWLVFYIPSGRGWTHGSLYYRQETGLVETPVTAQMALEVWYAGGFYLKRIRIRFLWHSVSGAGTRMSIAIFYFVAHEDVKCAGIPQEPLRTSGYFAMQHC